ncbi:MAG: hypothetical protein ABSH20_28970 [Tepidisphaeraceae bacterium]|jgi:undecaprenyl phosphate-alpha-L-ara4N flippase subunit ArnE
MTRKFRFPIFLFCLLMVLDVVVLLIEKTASNRAAGTGLHLATSFLSQPWVWMVLLLKVGQLFTWTAILARVDISLAFPLTSISYPLAMLAAVIVLSERPGWQIWIGGILITIGASVMGPGTHHQHTPLPSDVQS